MSEEDIKKHYTTATHQHTQPSTTLNRKYVQRPDIHRKDIIESIAKCQAENLRRRQELADKINHERLAAMKRKKLQQQQNHIEVSAPEPVEEDPLAQEISAPEENIEDVPADTSTEPECIIPTTPPPSPVETPKSAIDAEVIFSNDSSWPELSAKSAESLRDDAVKKALRSVATMEGKDKKAAPTSAKHTHRRAKRIVLAFACAAAVVVCIISFVAMNMPTTMAYVLSAQSGIENVYPNFTPHDAKLSTYSASNGTASMTFTIGEKNYSIQEEKSTWDSKTLLSSYVEPTWRSYDTVKEQGLTIYISGSNAAWVNGGIKYIITADSGALTQKQIIKIATSF